MKENYQIKGLLSYQNGLLAEKLAIRYLIDAGWDILQQRYRCGHGEIDVIATQKDWLIFVEVKARRDTCSGLYALTSKQQKRLFKAANYYLENYKLDINNIRFDLIAINRSNQIEHIENIILAE